VFGAGLLEGRFAEFFPALVLRRLDGVFGNVRHKGLEFFCVLPAILALAKMLLHGLFIAVV